MKKFWLGLAASCLVFFAVDTAKADHRSRNSCDSYRSHHSRHHHHGYSRHHHHHHHSYRPSYRSNFGGVYLGYPSYGRSCYSGYGYGGGFGGYGGYGYGGFPGYGGYGYGGNRIGFSIGF